MIRMLGLQTAQLISNPLRWALNQPQSQQLIIFIPVPRQRRRHIHHNLCRPLHNILLLLLAAPRAPQAQSAVLQNVVATAPTTPQAQLPATTAVTIATGVPPPVQPQPQPVAAQNIAAATPSASQGQPTPPLVPNGGLVLPQPAPSAQTRYKRPRRPAYARPLVPGDFYDPVAYARNPAGHDRAFNVLAQANLTGCLRFKNGTSNGPFAKNGELKDDFLSAVMINQSHGPCVNSYIRRYHGPAAQIFVGGGKMHRHMWNWYIALIQGPNGQFEEARFRRFVMEQVENQLLIDLPNLAQTIAQLKQIVVPPVGGALNPPANLGQNGINQTIGGGFNAPSNPGVHTMNQMAPAQGGGPTGGMSNRNESSRPGNKRQRDDVIVIDDHSDSGLAPPRPSKKARRSDGRTIKIETPSMQDWDGTLLPGMTLEDNYNRFMNSQPEGEQTEQTPPLQTHTRRRPIARGARNAPQVLNSSLPDRGADVGSPVMTSSDWDGEFQQPQFQDFDGYADRGDESWEGRRYPSPTQFEYGQSRQPSQQSGYGCDSATQMIWDSEPPNTRLPAIAQDYTYPDADQSRGSMAEGGFVHGPSYDWRA